MLHFSNFLNFLISYFKINHVCLLHWFYFFIHVTSYFSTLHDIIKMKILSQNNLQIHLGYYCIQSQLPFLTS